MKKVLLALFAVVVLAGASFANNFWVGGSLGYSSMSMNDESLNSFGVAPEFGYVINDKFDVGAGFRYTTIGSADEDIICWSFQPFARFAIAKTDKFEFYIKGGIGYGQGGPKEDFDDNKANVIEVFVQPVIAYNISENVSIFAAPEFFRYSVISPKEGDNDISGVNFNKNGFYYDSLFGAGNVGIAVKF